MTLARHHLVSADSLGRAFWMAACGGAGLLMAHIWAQHYAGYREIPDSVAMRHATTAALTWTGIGVGLGVIVGRVMRRTWILEGFLILVAVLLLVALSLPPARFH